MTGGRSPVDDTVPATETSRRVCLFALLAALVPTLVSQTGCAGQRSMADLVLLFPQHKKEDRTGLIRRTIEVSTGPVEVWVAQSPGAQEAGGPQAFVLLYSGNANLVEPVVKWVAGGIWKHRPVEVWGMNYPGYGGSAGRAKLSEIPEAALAAYDALAAHAGGKPIFLDGASMGGAVSLFVAARRPVAGIALLNPPPLREVVATHAWWNFGVLTKKVAAQVPDELDAIANARQCRVPLFAVVAERDEIVPARLQQAIYDNYAGPITLYRMKGATHGSHVNAEGQQRRQEWTDVVWRDVVERYAARAPGEPKQAGATGE